MTCVVDVVLVHELVATSLWAGAASDLGETATRNNPSFLDSKGLLQVRWRRLGSYFQAVSLSEGPYVPYGTLYTFFFFLGLSCPENLLRFAGDV